MIVKEVIKIKTAALTRNKYSISKTVDYDFKTALERTKEELKKEGFGVLTDIDVKKTLKQKIDKEFKNYEIFGACNPGFAYQALQMEEELGLLLPCNVIIYEDNQGKTVVSAIDPEKAMNVTDNNELSQVAGQITSHLEKVLEEL